MRRRKLPFLGKSTRKMTLSGTKSDKMKCDPYLFLSQWFLFRISTAVQPMTGIGGLKYQASDV